VQRIREAERAVDVAPTQDSRHFVSQEVGDDARSGPVTKPSGTGRDVADESGLRAAFLTHGSELLGFARRSLQSTELAEDAVQETFTRAWRSRRRFDPSLGSLRTWLFAIERRVILDLYDRQARHAAIPLEDDADLAVEDRIDAALLGWQIEAVLDKLAVEHRMVLTELYFNARSGREVSELFGIPEGTVRSRAYYALRSMRALLEEAGWDR
jgi:RNA polymerase sigma-70 factor (ECF subfamily)